MRHLTPVGPVFLPAVLLCLALLFPVPPGARAAGAPAVAWEAVIDSVSASGHSAFDVMNDVVPTADGGAVAAGYSLPAGSFGPGGDPQQALVVRFDATGTERWRAYLGDGDDDYEVRRIRQTADGGFLVACTAFTPFPAGSPGLYYHTSFAAKLDAGGVELWRYRFDPLALDFLGDFDLSPDGSILAAGRVWGPGGSTAVAVARLSTQGELLWLRRTPPEHLETVSRVAAAADGGLFAASGTSHRNAISRFAADGSLLWTAPLQGLDGELYFYEKDIHGLRAAPDGGCSVVGARRVYHLPTYGPYQAFTAAFDASGRQAPPTVVPTASQWTHAAEQLADGGIVAAEGVQGSDTGILLVRYDAAGREVWRLPPGPLLSQAYVNAIRVSADGGLAVAGAVEAPVRWGPFDGYVFRLEAPVPADPTCAAIDVRPGSRENTVNYAAQGLLPVALLSSACFDAAAVRPASLALEDAPVARNPKGRFHAVRRDVDGDGRTDLLLHFSVPSLGLGLGRTAVTLQGVAPNGSAFSASDAIRVVGPPAKKPAPKTSK